MLSTENLVLVAASATTIWLVYYVRVYLPSRIDDRFRESLKAFSTAIELRFPSQAGTSARVVALSQAVGVEMGLRQSRLRDLEMAAVLRDIGLCSVPYDLMNGRNAEDWSEKERILYQRHAVVSGAMLESVPSLSRIAPAVRLHHVPYATSAREDGAIALAGDSLPLESRILRVVTEYVSLERDLGSMLAKQTIRQGIGTLYCPACSRALLSVLTSARNGEVGVHAASPRS